MISGFAVDDLRARIDDVCLRPSRQPRILGRRPCVSTDPTTSRVVPQNFGSCDIAPLPSTKTGLLSGLILLQAPWLPKLDP